VLVIKAQQHRSQDLNRMDALLRLHALVQSAAIPPRVRRATEPSFGSRQRRLDGKKPARRSQGSPQQGTT